MRSPSTGPAYSALALAAVLWGGSIVAQKLALGSFSAVEASVLRDIGGLATGTFDPENRAFSLSWDHLFDGHKHERLATFVLRGVIDTGPQPVPTRTPRGPASRPRARTMPNIPALAAA